MKGLRPSMTPLLLSTSERSLFKKCRWAYQWPFMKRLEPTVAAPALRFGTLVHLALEKRHPPGVKRGPHPAATFRKLYDQEIKLAYKYGFRDEDNKWQEAGELGEAMMNNYVDTYGDDEEWRVIASEQVFTVPIIDPDTGREIAKFASILDGIWINRFDKRIIIVDHKTAGTISTKHLFMDEQASAYWAYGVDWLYENGILKPNQKLKEIMFNFMLKSPPDPRPTDSMGRSLNQDGSISQKQPAPRFLRYASLRDQYDRDMLKRRVADEVKEIKAVRRGKLALLKSPSPINCATCSVRDLCELHETGHDFEAMARQTMVKKKLRPYEEAIEYARAH